MFICFLQVWTYLHSSNPDFQEYILLLCQQICMKSENVLILLDMGAVEFAESLIVSGVWNSLYLPAVNLLEKVGKIISILSMYPFLPFLFKYFIVYFNVSRVVTRYTIMQLLSTE